MNKIMIRYKQLDFDRKDFETQIISIETVDELYQFKTMCQCDTMYTHVQISLCDEEEDFIMNSIEKVVHSHRFGAAVFNTIENMLFDHGLYSFFM